MITYYHRSVKDKRLRPVTHPNQAAVGVITSATNEDLVTMATQLNLSTSALVDLFDAQEIPRFDVEKKVVILFVRLPLPLENSEYLETQLYMLCYNQSHLYVATSGNTNHFLEMLSQNTIPTSQSQTLLVEFLLYLSKKYSLYINEISKKVEFTKTRLKALDNGYIEELINYEVILNEYVSVLSPMQQISSALVNGKFMGWADHHRDLLADLTTSMAQSNTVCLVNLKKISTLRDSFQILYTNRLNQTLKVLTSATIILTIPTMIASLFGMNVGIPLSFHPQAFWLVVTFSLLLVSGLVVVFKQKDWF